MMWEEQPSMTCGHHHTKREQVFGWYQNLGERVCSGTGGNSTANTPADTSADTLSVNDPLYSLSGFVASLVVSVLTVGVLPSVFVVVGADVPEKGDGAGVPRHTLLEMHSTPGK